MKGHSYRGKGSSFLRGVHLYLYMVGVVYSDQQTGDCAQREALVTLIEVSGCSQHYGRGLWLLSLQLKGLVFLILKGHGCSVLAEGGAIVTTMIVTI